ncbi:MULTISPECIES: hypothetical protein [unclassified Variovorax]|uniref:hypothetical protein n=1 Tax=unclassified Variovorax TaxID=663243 RepID=UPI001BD3AE2C|nr:MULTISPECIES: hypothetical protein [unclassified Variovorax]
MNRQQQLDQFSLALHRRAIQVLRRDPALRTRALDTIARWRLKTGATRSDLLWNEWEHLLGNDGFEALEDPALAEPDHGQLMRSVSPMGGLIDQHERARLLKLARGQVAVP